jgi:hypothetical protein
MWRLCRPDQCRNRVREKSGETALLRMRCISSKPLSQVGLDSVLQAFLADDMLRNG